MTAAVVLWQRHMRKFLRSPMEIVATLFLPLLLMGLFGMVMRRVLTTPIEGLDYLSYILPGVLALTALTASVMGGATLLSERLNGVVKEYMVCPIPRMSILLGAAASGLTKALLQCVIILLVGVLMGVQLSLSLVGILVSLAAFAAFTGGFVGIALATASRTESMEAYHSLIMFFNVPVFLSNSLYPMEAMPFWLQVVSRLNPTTYLVNSLRAGLLAPAPALGAVADVAVLVVFALACLFWAGRAFRKVVS